MSAPKGPRPLTRAIKLLGEAQLVAETTADAMREDALNHTTDGSLQQAWEALDQIAATITEAKTIVKSRHAGSDTPDPSAKKIQAARKR